MQPAPPEPVAVRSVPSYGLHEAARYLGVPPATLRMWLQGRPRRGAGATGRCRPLIPAGRAHGALRLCFDDLVGAWILRELRRRRTLSLARIRRGLRRALDHLGSARPLAQLDLRSDGEELYVMHEGRPRCLSCRGQLTLPDTLPPPPAGVVRGSDGAVARLQSRRGAVAAVGGAGVVLDPTVAFGLPVLGASGVPTAVIAARHRAGEPLAALAERTGCSRADAAQALRWEGTSERPRASDPRASRRRPAAELPLLESLRRTVRSAPDVPTLWVDRSCAGPELRAELEPCGLRIELRQDHQRGALEPDHAWLGAVAAGGGVLLVRQPAVRPGDLLCTAAATWGLAVFVLTGRNLDGAGEVAAILRGWQSMLRWSKELPRPFVARVLTGGVLRRWHPWGPTAAPPV